MNQAKRNSGVGVGNSEKMICVECFRAKGDEDLKMPCQNPRCHFYLCTPSGHSSSRQEMYSNEMLSPSFNKEVGHDRKSKPYCYESYPSQLSSKDWRSQSSANMPHTSSQKMRSKSASTSSGSGGNASMQKFLNTSLVSSKEGGKQKFFRSHYVSLPEYADSYLGRECQLQGDLVEDAFVSSPLLMDYGERVEDRVRICIIQSYIH